MRAVDLTGQRFANLTAIAKVGKSRNGQAVWLWRCGCGTEKAILATSVLTGNTASCGCLRPQAPIRQVQCASCGAHFETKRPTKKFCSNRCVGDHKKSHGMCFPRTPEYAAWCNMIGRCNNKNDARYSSYGGRGIQVCERWRKFENFLADIGLKPSKGLSLDRKDNDGDYEPGNCRWATAKEQANNTRRTRRAA